MLCYIMVFVMCINKFFMLLVCFYDGLICFDCFLLVLGFFEIFFFYFCIVVLVVWGVKEKVCKIVVKFL